MERWSVGSFNQIDWHWPREFVKPLSTVLRHRCEVVNREDHDFASLQLATLHFDGELEPRELRGKVEFKGKLFFAHAGDVIYSKIDVRNGAIGIVPDSMPRVAVSAEYPVYQVDAKLASPDYIQLVFRTRVFRARINAMISGASGRKRVQPDALEKVDVPLPPLADQRAIVERWRSAQAQIAAAGGRVAKMESKIPQMIYDSLGIPARASTGPKQKLLALQWAELERWSVGYLNRARTGLLGFTESRYPIVPLAENLVETMNGYCIKPVPGPTPFRMLKLNVLQPEGLDLSATKFVNMPDSVAERFCLHKGDLLICRSVGSFDMIAKSAVVEVNSPDILFPDIIIRARLKSTLLPAYVREVMQTPQGRSHFQSNARTAVGMWKIGADDIASFPIPLPPLAVQRKLVERVTAARAEIARERAAAAALRQTIAAEVEALILGTKPLSPT